MPGAVLAIGYHGSCALWEGSCVSYNRLIRPDLLNYQISYAIGQPVWHQSIELAQLVPSQDWVEKIIMQDCK